MSDQLSLQPAIRRGMRLQWGKVQDCHVLLYPEGMVKLNETSAAILQLCDGQHTFAQITTILQERYQAADLAADGKRRAQAPHWRVALLHGGWCPAPMQPM